AGRTLRRLHERRVLEAAEVAFEASDVGEPRRSAAGFLDALLITVGVVLEIAGPAGLEEQLAGHRRGQLRRGGVIGRRVPDDRRGLRIVVRLHVVATVLVDLVEIGGELVLRADLPRRARHGALDELIIDTG